MSVPTNPRPWFCIDGAVENYHTVLKDGGDLEMLKTLKIIRSILVIAVTAAISLYALYLGADPTIVAIFALPGLAAYAGVEAADYAALVQAYQEIKRGDGE